MLLFDTTADDVRMAIKELRKSELQPFPNLKNNEQKNPELSSKYIPNASVLADPSIVLECHVRISVEPRSTNNKPNDLVARSTFHIVIIYPYTFLFALLLFLQLYHLY